MRKVITLLIISICCCGVLSGCGNMNEFSSKQKMNNYDNNSIQHIEESNEESNENNSTDEEKQVIYDNQNIKITFDSIQDGGYSSNAGGDCLWMSLSIENNSDYLVDFEFKYLSINGLLLFNGYGEDEGIYEAKAHETASSSMAIPYIFLGESGIDTIKSIEMVLDIEHGPDHSVITTDPLVVNVDIPCDFEANNYGSGTSLSSTDGLTFNYCSTKINTREYDESNDWAIFTFYFENTTSSDLDILFRNIIINEESTYYTPLIQALAGMKGYAVITIPGQYIDNLEVEGVSSLNDINSVSAVYTIDCPDDGYTILAEGEVKLY